jgi:hemin uptake protein HemP
MTIQANFDPRASVTLLRDPAPVHEAQHLTGGGTTARIVLDGQVYTLRITRAGKLILTK